MVRRFADPSPYLYLKKSYRVSIRRACGVLAVCRPTTHYRSVKVDDPALRSRITEMRPHEFAIATRVSTCCPSARLEGQSQARLPNLPRGRPRYAPQAGTRTEIAITTKTLHLSS
jgi:hypothetical protein